MKKFNLDKFNETISNMRNPENSGYKTATFKTVRWTKYDRDRLYINMCLRGREIDMGYIDLKSENFSYYVSKTGELDTISNRINDIRKENIKETVDETVEVEETVDEAVEETETTNEADKAADEAATASKEEKEIENMTIETLLKKGKIENEEEFKLFTEDRTVHVERWTREDNTVDVRIDLIHNKLNCYAEIVTEEKVINDDGETELVFDEVGFEIKFYLDFEEYDSYEEMLSEITTVYSENGDEITEGTRMMASELFNMISEKTLENDDLTLKQLIRNEVLVDYVGTYDRFGCGNGYKIPVRIDITFSVLEETEDDAEIFLETVSLEEA